MRNLDSLKKYALQHFKSNEYKVLLEMIFMVNILNSLFTEIHMIEL